MSNILDINYSLWNFKEIKQEFTSENTSINSIKMPKTIKKIEPTLIAGQKWADIGGVVSLIILKNIYILLVLNFMFMILSTALMNTIVR